MWGMWVSFGWVPWVSLSVTGRCFIITTCIHVLQEGQVVPCHSDRTCTQWSHVAGGRSEMKWVMYPRSLKLDLSSDSNIFPIILRWTSGYLSIPSSKYPQHCCTLCQWLGPRVPQYPAEKRRILSCSTAAVLLTVLWLWAITPLQKRRLKLMALSACINCLHSSVILEFSPLP